MPPEFGEFKTMKTVVIVGAGPCGLMMAHTLLKRDRTYRVELYDNRPDPRLVPASTARAYSISLAERGRTALRAVGLEAIVEQHGTAVWGKQIHHLLGREWFVPVSHPRLVIERSVLTQILLDTLIQQYGTDRLSLHFDHKCIAVDQNTKSAMFQSANGQQQITSYDLLLGADGVRSTVRRYLQSTGCDVKTRTGLLEMKAIILRCPADQPQLQIKRDRTHIYPFGSDGVLVVMPKSNGTFSGLVVFIRGRNPLADASSGQDVLAFFRQHMQEHSQYISIEEAEAFVQKPFFQTTTVVCDRYHDQDSLLLVGDAAHAVSPTLGQGCNAAFEDADVFNQLLDKYNDDLSQAVPQFTTRRQPDMAALEKISDSLIPLNKFVAFGLLCKHLGNRLLHQWFPEILAPSSFEMLSDATVPYRDILQLHSRRVKVVTAFNQTVVQFSTPV